MDAPKYRTDSQACSCPGFWFRHTCKHYRAYAEAVALVLAQDAANLAWETERVGGGAVRGSHATPTPAIIAGVGECAILSAPQYHPQPIHANIASIGD